MLSSNLPKTVDEAVETLISELTLKERAKIARMGRDELKVLHITFGPHIREKFGFWSGNEALMESCRVLGGDGSFDISKCSQMIIDALWARLRRTHALRAVK